MSRFGPSARGGPKFPRALDGRHGALPSVCVGHAVAAGVRRRAVGRQSRTVEYAPPPNHPLRPPCTYAQTESTLQSGPIHQHGALTRSDAPRMERQSSTQNTCSRFRGSPFLDGLGVGSAACQCAWELMSLDRRSSSALTICRLGTTSTSCWGRLPTRRSLLRLISSVHSRNFRRATAARQFACARTTAQNSCRDIGSWPLMTARVS